ncbi:MAG: S-layer homology domain-containing protein [Candidatus Gracilibacteria bacterium]|nr:S-layer homology domain-containing protein [Candidatus Peregrinibacteria bacterium]
MNIFDFIKTNRTIALYIVLGIIGTVVAIAAIYLGGNLYQGSLISSTQLNQSLQNVTTNQPSQIQVQTTPSTGGPITCSGTPNPADPNQSVTWTMVVNEAMLQEEDPYIDIESYFWSGDTSGGTANSEKTFTVSYPNGKTTATVTPIVSVLTGPDNYEDIAGTPCSITINSTTPSNTENQTQTENSASQATISCTGSPNPGTTGQIVTWTIFVDEAKLMEEQPHNGITSYFFLDEDGKAPGQESENGKVLKTVYPAGTTSATLTPVVNILTGPNFDTGIEGEDCSITLEDPVPENENQEEETETQTTEETETTTELVDTEEETTETQTGTLPAKDILTCAFTPKPIIQEKNESALAICGLNESALVEAYIMPASFTPSETIDTSAAITTILPKTSKQAAPFNLSWNAQKDKFDQPVAEGTYTFVVAARPNNQYLPDLSIREFTVLAKEPEVEEPEPTPQQEQTPTETTQTESTTQTSACEGVDYPSDIAGHWAESIIKSAYDACLIQGYEDGTFRPDQAISRAEAVKLVLSLAGISPHQGCYSANCGAGYPNNFFNDITATWQGPWVRAAWDEGIVEGYGANEFGPQFAITRAEATALTARTFKVPAHQGCYTANCGAGHPDNLFNDITDAWQGPWVRTAWDNGWISGISANRFEPNRPITRAELLKMAKLAATN